MKKASMLGLKNARIKKGLSRAALASQIGVEAHTVFRYENGDRHPDIEILKAISKILDCTIDDLIGEPRNPTPAPARKRGAGAGGQ